MLLSQTKCWQNSKRHAPGPRRAGVRNRGSLTYILPHFTHDSLKAIHLLAQLSVPSLISLSLWRTGTFFHRSSPDPSPACSPGWFFNDPSGCHFLFPRPPPQHIMWFSFSSHQLFTLMHSPWQDTANQHLQTSLYYLYPRLLTIYPTSKPNKLLLYSVSLSDSDTVDHLKISSVSLTPRYKNHLLDILTSQSLLHYFSLVNFKAKMKVVILISNNNLFILSWTTWGEAYTLGRKREILDILVYKVLGSSVEVPVAYTQA